MHGGGHITMVSTTTTICNYTYHHLCDNHLKELLWAWPLVVLLEFSAHLNPNRLDIRSTHGALTIGSLSARQALVAVFARPSRQPPDRKGK